MPAPYSLRLCSRCPCFSPCVATESNVKTSSFAIHLSHMGARENSAPVKASLETLSQRLDAAETERLKVLAQLQALIVNKFSKYPGEIKVARNNIDARNRQVSEYARAAKEYASAKASGNPTRLHVAQGNMRVAEEHMRSAEDVLNKELGDFEHARVSEMKEMMRRYIRNEIYFHAKSIEGLTAAYQEVVKIDPDTEKAVRSRHTRAERKRKQPMEWIRDKKLISTVLALALSLSTVVPSPHSLTGVPRCEAPAAVHSRRRWCARSSSFARCVWRADDCDRSYAHAVACSRHRCGHAMSNARTRRPSRASWQTAGGDHAGIERSMLATDGPPAFGSAFNLRFVSLSLLQSQSQSHALSQPRSSPSF